MIQKAIMATAIFSLMVKRGEDAGPNDQVFVLAHPAEGNPNRTHPSHMEWVYGPNWKQTLLRRAATVREWASYHNELAYRAATEDERDEHVYKKVEYLREAKRLEATASHGTRRMRFSALLVCYERGTRLLAPDEVSAELEKGCLSGFPIGLKGMLTQADQRSVYVVTPSSPSCEPRLEGRRLTIPIKYMERLIQRGDNANANVSYSWRKGKTELVWTGNRHFLCVIERPATAGGRVTNPGLVVVIPVEVVRQAMRTIDNIALLGATLRQNGYYGTSRVEEAPTDEVGVDDEAVEMPDEPETDEGSDEGAPNPSVVEPKS